MLPENKRPVFSESFFASCSAYENLPESDLKTRKQVYCKIFDVHYREFKKGIIPEMLSGNDAFELADLHTDWVDQWIRFTWSFVTSEGQRLLKQTTKASGQKLSYLKTAIPQKQQKKEHLEAFLAQTDGSAEHLNSAETAYYNNQISELQREITELEQELKRLEDIVPQISTCKIDEKRLLKILSVFARGGYGRRELTFSSDVDIAYCINPKQATYLEIHAAQELIRRMEDLFQGIDLDTASQYFELGEDLSRFSRTDMLHTIPSILEGRVILGKQSDLNAFKKEMLAICPPEKMIRYLKKQMDDLAPEKGDTLNIKEGFGGIRHLQYVLWMVLIVDNHENGNSKHLIEFLYKKGWITKNDQINLEQSLEFYFDLRNFIGLQHFCKEKLKQLDIDGTFERVNFRKDMLNDLVAMAYLKLKSRFVTVDYMDRFRLSSLRTISSLAQSIVGDMLNRTIVESLPGLILYKHLGTNRIIRFQHIEEKPRSSWNFKVLAEEKRKSREDQSKDRIKELFLNGDNLHDLFVYIGKTGNVLSPELADGFSMLVPELYDETGESEGSKRKEFIFRLFTAENTAVAIKQMMEISAPLERDGHIKTLLGHFIPEANQMRFLLRNLETHEYPLCVHSIKSLEQVEQEIEKLQKDEPELWRFISTEDIFALKWATFFHDVGKINPYRDHEKLGPMLSTEMLLRLGWNEGDNVLASVRLLISNHQSVVRFSQLSTYLDIGIIKFFELAQRDPAKAILLYLINLSDFKSVNSEMSHRAAHLENFFEKAMSILGEFKREELSGSVTDVVNSWLDRKVEEARTLVLLDLLLTQCCHKNLEDVIINPLRKKSPEQVQKLETYRDDLENSLAFLKLAELDAASLEKHRFRFIQIIRRVISEENVFSLVSPLSRGWDWFFSAIPNRYLLSSSTEVLTTQLHHFEGHLQEKIRLSYVRGERGEYDSILFHYIGSGLDQAKIAYALSWQGVNIENGKINKVRYGNDDVGYVGFFKISKRKKADTVSSVELETMIRNLVIPPLNPPLVSEKRRMSQVQVTFFQEQEKGYIIREISRDKFKRVPQDYLAVKISLYDAPFVFYKIIRSFEAIGVPPQQVTITTIGNQIIDYFYVERKYEQKLRQESFKSVLEKYINAEITLA